MVSVKNSSPEITEAHSSYLQIKYRDLALKECCGVGSFGTVYCAHWISQKRCVAVKVVSRLDEEVNILSTLHHDNIIEFYGACCEAPNFCIVSEYAPHGSLHSFLSSTPGEDLMFTQMLSWAKDISSGMKYLHEEASVQVVHRDLKSKNILIGNGNCLKICDFGSSRVFDETVVMTFAGTYPWMAPELIQGLPTSTLCDVYSFGIVLWEILTKEVPFNGLQGFQVAWVVVENHERPVIPNSCPQPLSNLIQQCWQGDPSFRPSFREIFVKLDGMLMDVGLEKATNTFAQTKSIWVDEMKNRMEVMKNNEVEEWAVAPAAEKRNEIIKKWSKKMGKELMKHSIYKYSYESFQRSVSFSDESQIINSHCNSVMGTDNFTVKNDSQVKSASVASVQKSSLQTNMAQVLKNDYIVGPGLDSGNANPPRYGSQHQNRMKKQHSLGSLEFKGVSDFKNHTDYRRLLSAPIQTGSINTSTDMHERITVTLSPAMIAEALANDTVSSSFCARRIFDSIKETVTRFHGDNNAVDLNNSQQQEISRVRNIGRNLERKLCVDNECQTDNKEMIVVATQTMDEMLHGTDINRISNPAIVSSHEFDCERLTVIGDNLAESHIVDGFNSYAAEASGFQTSWSTEGGLHASRERSVLTGWRRKDMKSSMLDSSFKDHFL